MMKKEKKKMRLSPQKVEAETIEEDREQISHRIIVITNVGAVEKLGTTSTSASTRITNVIFISNTFPLSNKNLVKSDEEEK